MSPTIIQGHEIAGRMPLFIKELRQANREDKKRQTRRIPTRANSLVDGSGASKALFADLDFSKAWADSGPSPAGNPGPYLKVPRKNSDTIHRVYPRYQVGDIRVMCEPLRNYKGEAVYVEGGGPIFLEGSGWRTLKWRWKRDILTSIHMPHEAGRSLFEITGIRAERVQDISAEDCIAEGLYREFDGSHWWYGISAEDQFLSRHPKIKFSRLWDSINAKRGFPYSSNPMNWVYDYRRVE